MPSRQLTAAERLDRITECGLCIGCGLCQSIAGPERVRMTAMASGDLRPVVVGELDHALVDTIYDTCPGTRIDGLPRHLVDADTVNHPVWGDYQSLVRAYAANPKVRFRGSTGGVLTALALYLIESGTVDFILHVKASAEHPILGEQHVSTSTADVLDAAGSRYGPTATLDGINAALDRGQPFAYVGKPCDIGALRNYARHDERVNELVRYWLTPVCGGYSPPANTRAFVTRSGVEQTQLKALSYRGFGCPGPTRIETHDGRVIDRNYIDLWGEDETQWSLPTRCKICPDGIGDSADIAAADTWPGGSPEREGQERDEGTNAVIIRTRAGAALMDAAVQAGHLTIEQDIAPEDLDLYQPHQVNKKYAAWARHAGLRAAGQLAPRTSGVRIRELAATMDRAFLHFQARGTRQRVHAGRTREPAPRHPGDGAPIG